jgi:hypothetical protein
MADEKKLPVISVRGAGTDNKVVLWERHPDHPDKENEGDELGEAFVTNEKKWRKVAETPEVKRLIAEGVLVKKGSKEDEDGEVETASSPHGLGGKVQPKPKGFGA